MRALLAVLVALPLCAQIVPAQEAAKPEPSAPAETQATAPQPPPAAPPAEPGFTGSIDFGYRWVSSAGSFDTYRSVVNLGEGPKLFGLNFSFEGKRLFDRLNVDANNWGGDPYNTLRVNAVKHGWYDFRADYRNISYFNFLPSFADPTAPAGLVDQRSYDIQRRTSDFQLDLFPGTRFIPYLAYGRNSNFGNGITAFVGSSNEFPVRSQIRDSMDDYRGGLRIELSRFHVTAEEGGTVLKDDQQNFSSGTSFGNRTTPVFGQRLVLNSLQQAYGIRGHSTYSRGLVTANPFSWLDLNGQFLYSIPSNTASYSQINAGNFVQQNPLLIFVAQSDLFTGLSRMPHTTAGGGAELRPFKRLRIVESLLTDRLHTSSSGTLSQLLFPGGAAAAVPQTVAASERLVMNYNQQEVNVFFDIFRGVTLRGGHRYVWGDAVIPPSPLTPQGETGENRRQVGIAGLSLRSWRKFSLNFDFEGASSDASYFRTSLNDYQLGRLRARYQALNSLLLTGSFSYLHNTNPAAGSGYSLVNRNNSLSAVWTPRGGKRISLLAEYTRSTLRSDITYLVPQTLTPSRSFYRDDAHVIDGLVDLTLPRSAKFSFGGSFFLSSGSRPNDYYQPLGRLLLPLCKRVSLVTEWHYYGFGEPFYTYEAFRAHLFTTGLRISR